MIKPKWHGRSETANGDHGVAAKWGVTSYSETSIVYNAVLASMLLKSKTVITKFGHKMNTHKNKSMSLREPAPKQGATKHVKDYDRI